MEFRLIKSPNPEKKWRAIFTDKAGKETHTDFGAAGMSDYTQHRDPLRKQRYLLRHRTRENWKDPKTAGALSRWILWNEPTLAGSIKSFKTRFSLA